jgi:hypothetical protein
MAFATSFSGRWRSHVILLLCAAPDRGANLPGFLVQLAQLARDSVMLRCLTIPAVGAVDNNSTPIPVPGTESPRFRPRKATLCRQ